MQGKLHYLATPPISQNSLIRSNVDDEWKRGYNGPASQEPLYVASYALALLQVSGILLEVTQSERTLKQSDLT